MLEAVHVVMRAVMRTWFRDVVDALSTMPRAYGVPQAHATGLDPDRILVFGNGLAAGWGVASHDLAIPGELARSLSAITGRGVDVDVTVDTTLRISGALRAIEERDLSSYDAIVVIVGSSDALSHTPRSQWKASMRELIACLVEHSSASARIVIVGQSPIRPVPPFDNVFGRIANSYSKTLNGITRELCRDVPRVGYMMLPNVDGPATERLGTPERYRVWGRHIALHLVPYLDEGILHPALDPNAESSARDGRNQPQSDDDRYRAIDGLGILNGETDEEIDRIVSTARALFGTQGAAFTLIGRDRQWHKSIAGFDPTELPLELSVCAVTIRAAGPLVVENARDDPRFSPRSPMTFYAGYPIEAPDGQRIGALCVFDHEPRNPSTVDPAILRDLALLIQERLWQYSLPHDGGPETPGIDQ